MDAPAAGAGHPRRRRDPDREDRLANPRKTGDRIDVLTALERQGMSRRRVCVTLPRQAPMSPGHSSAICVPSGAGAPGCANGSPWLRLILGRSLLVAIAVLASSCSQDLVAIAPASGTTGGSSSTCIGDPCNYSDTTHPNQCCQGATCIFGTCSPVDAGACAEFGDPCLSASSCCSDYGSTCESVAQATTRICVSAYCLRIGAPCAIDGECCSLACQAGNCANSRPCGVQNEQCSSDSDCCSMQCVSGQCGNPYGTCHTTGDSCEISQDCCSQSCIDVGNGRRCLSNGCFWADDNCTDSRECCSKSCINSRCAPPCGLPPSSCSSNEDCCYQHCIPSVTGQSAGTCASCSNIGDPCSTGANCCSNQCADDGTGTGQLRCVSQ